MLANNSAKSDLLVDDERFSSGAMKMDDNPFFLKTMVTKTYEMVWLAIARELLCNAAPSDSGSTEFSMELTKNQVIIKDNGRSMSHEFMMTTYATAGKSTKSKSNDSIGGYGIGKLSVTAANKEGEFTVICATGDGLLRSYLVSIERGCRLEGVPEQIEKGITGTTVIANIDPEGYDQLYQAGVYCTLTLGNRLIVQGIDVTEGLRDKYESLKIYQDSKITLFRRNPFVELGCRFYAQHAFFEMGKIAYPINLSQIQQSHGLNLDQATLFLHEPIGSVEVATSRESLFYDTAGNTKRHVETALRSAGDKVREVMLQEMIKLADKFNAIGYYSMDDEQVDPLASNLYSLYELDRKGFNLMLVEELTNDQKLACSFMLARASRGKSSAPIEPKLDWLIQESEGYSIYGDGRISNDKGTTFWLGSFSGVAITEGPNKTAHKSVVKDLRDKVKKSFGKRHSYPLMWVTPELKESDRNRVLLLSKFTKDLMERSTSIVIESALAYSRATSGTSSAPKAAKPKREGLKGELYEVSISSVSDLVKGQAPIKFTKTDMDSGEVDEDTFFMALSKQDDPNYRVFNKIALKTELLGKTVKIFNCPPHLTESKKLDPDLKAKKVEQLFELKELSLKELPAPSYIGPKTCGYGVHSFICTYLRGKQNDMANLVGGAEMIEKANKAISIFNSISPVARYQDVELFVENLFGPSVLTLSGLVPKFQALTDAQKSIFTNLDRSISLNGAIALLEKAKDIR